MYFKNIWPRQGLFFSPKDFSDIGTRSSIDWALHRLIDKNIIRRVIRGIYDYPRKSSFSSGYQTPDIYLVADAIARKHNWTLIPSGETAVTTVV